MMWVSILKDLAGANLCLRLFGCGGERMNTGLTSLATSCIVVKRTTYRLPSGPISLEADVD